MTDDQPPNELRRKRRERMHPIERLFEDIDDRQRECRRAAHASTRRRSGYAVATSVLLCVLIEVLRAYTSDHVALTVLISMVAINTAHGLFDV